MPPFAEIFDYYQAAVYPGREALAGAIAAQFSLAGSTRVPDCACGTGLPAIDLRTMGIPVRESPPGAVRAGWRKERTAWSFTG